MKKYLGVDYGTKKIGLALSDDAGVLAFPHSVVINSKDAHEQIKEIAKANSITDVVVGYSKDLDGTENPIMENIIEFQKELEGEGFSMFLEPEFWSTFQAKRMNDDSVADASAAAIILQSYLDRV